MPCSRSPNSGLGCNDEGGYPIFRVRVFNSRRVNQALFFYSEGAEGTAPRLPAMVNSMVQAALVIGTQSISISRFMDRFCVLFHEGLPPTTAINLIRRRPGSDGGAK